MPRRGASPKAAPPCRTRSRGQDRHACGLRRCVTSRGVGPRVAAPLGLPAPRRKVSPARHGGEDEKVSCRWRCPDDRIGLPAATGPRGDDGHAAATLASRRWPGRVPCGVEDLDAVRRQRPCCRHHVPCPPRAGAAPRAAPPHPRRRRVPQTTWMSGRRMTVARSGLSSRRQIRRRAACAGLGDDAAQGERPACPSARKALGSSAQPRHDPATVPSRPTPPQPSVIPLPRHASRPANTHSGVVGGVGGISNPSTSPLEVVRGP